MAKSRFKTKLTKKQKRNNILVILAVIAFFYAFTLWFSFAISIFEDWTDPDIYIIGLGMAFFVPSMLVFPFVIAGAVLGLQKGKAKRIRDDSTFVAVQNLDYYRDNLSELSPAIVSLLIDLDIYGKKDIAATLLRMQNKGVIHFNKTGGIIAVAEKMQDLDDGEIELLNIIKNGKLNNKKLLLQWMKNRFNDAEKLGYIKKKAGISNEPKGVPLLLGIVSFICGFAVWGWFIGSSFFDRFDSLIGVLEVFAVLLVIDLLFFMPMYLLTRLSMYNQRFRHHVWERTELGNETAEKIFGLARFIHEFSLLSEAKKEQVALWDDYLVYAIVLEENEQIVEDIVSLYKIDSRSFEKLHSRHT